MDTRGGLAYVRPVGGGVERTVDPARIAPLPNGPEVVVTVVPSRPRGTGTGTGTGAGAGAGTTPGGAG
ncbi:hypothetical protein ACPC54_35765 [Kitasatospora sp. NPDC094028]